MKLRYDVIVVGGGHAGCEAACAAANLGSSTLLITMDMNRFAQMSCNPAMGGVAKGQIIREIDALGGFSGIVADKSSIQFRMLNKSKGPALWSPRTQNDRFKFVEEWRKIVENTTHLDLWQDTVNSLIIKDKTICGLKTKLGLSFTAKSIVLTNGTFLNGLMHIGKIQIAGGRIAEASDFLLSSQLADIGHSKGRMKTGTPPRLDARSIDFSRLSEQPGDDTFHSYSYLPNISSELKQRSCYLAHTNTKVHDILHEALSESPLFDGTIQSIGPRYCPSIETKIVTFSERDSHHLFLEPEGEDTQEFYLNGFSSSLPLEIQYRALQCIEGFEHVKMYKPGYAIEYDFFDPTQLELSLESKLVSGLFFAGQINGTTGYEEAAGQGLIAGINAHLKVHSDNKTFTLNRDQAYLGVLIDDLCSKGVDEPYRMFTSRAEYRILLRQDNADTRLTTLAYDLGLASAERKQHYDAKKNYIDQLLKLSKKCSLDPELVNPILISMGSMPLKQKVRLGDVVVRPGVGYLDLISVVPELACFLDSCSIQANEIVERAEIELKYAGYIERESIMAQKISRLDNLPIEGKFDYNSLLSMSTEARQKLNRIQPKTIGQARRISGVSPADISVLLLMLGK